MIARGELPAAFSLARLTPSSGLLVGVLRTMILHGFEQWGQVYLHPESDSCKPFSLFRQKVVY